MDELIPEPYRVHLKEVLGSKLELPVSLAVETCAGCENCDRAVKLAKELSGLEPRITMTVRRSGRAQTEGRSAEGPKLPAIVIGGRRPSSVTFFGAPIGSELDVLVDAIFAASRSRSRLPAGLATRLRELPDEVRAEVFVSPACRRCPPVARFLMEASMESPKVRVDIVEAFEFPELARRYDVRNVPTVVLGSGAVKLRDATVAGVASLLLSTARA
ncbi:MAG TPA: thioredoxin family protein [Conexivisphaerales archaeon]|nr:thioredoxin family protein [Conexivisphaerales archaeon]